MKASAPSPERERGTGQPFLGPLTLAGTGLRGLRLPASPLQATQQRPWREGTPVARAAQQLASLHGSPSWA